jgi:hypothetical protein
MLQLMDLARENVALKCELERIRQEAEELQRLVSGADGSAQTTSGASAAPRFRHCSSGNRRRLEPEGAASRGRLIPLRAECRACR